MPQIPGLPIDEPVSGPQAHPGIFGAVGGAVEGMGQEVEQMAAGNQQFEQHLIEAQRYLKAKQAEIAYDQTLNQVHADLAKTTTPEEAQAVYQHAKGQLAGVLQPFETDRVLSRQLAIFGAEQDVQLQNTVNGRKATLIQKGDDASNDLLYKKSLEEGINIGIAGGDPSVARSQLKAKLDASVHVMGTMTPQQAEAVMEKWDTDWEKGTIEAYINSPSPATRRQNIKNLQAGESIPHLDKGTVNALLSHAEEVDKRLTQLQEVANENQDINNVLQTAKSAPFTDAQGITNYDTLRAQLNDPKFVESQGMITTDPTTGKVIPDMIRAEKVRSYLGAAEQDNLAQAKKKADQDRDEIYDMFAKGNISGGLNLARQKLPDFQKAKVDYFPQIVSGAKSWQAEQRAESRFARSEARDAEIDKQRAIEDKGLTTSDQLFQRISNGDELDFNRDIESEVHKGNLTNKQAHELWYDYNQSTKNPDYQNGLGIINSSPLDAVTKAKTATEFRRSYRQGGLTGNQVTDKAKGLVDDAGEKSTSSVFQWIKSKLGSTAVQAPSLTPAPITKPTKPSTAATVDFTDGGKVYHIPSDQVSEFEKDHPNATAN